MPDASAGLARRQRLSTHGVAMANSGEIISAAHAYGARTVRCAVLARSGLLVAVMLVGCATGARLEVGVRHAGAEAQLRVGASIALGIGGATPGIPRPAVWSLTQSIGYRRLGNHSATTATRATHNAGPLLIEGALELSRDGIEALPALLVPVHRSVTCIYDIDDCGGPHTASDLRGGIKAWDAFAVGLQPRLGMEDNHPTYGVDLVFAYLGYSGIPGEDHDD